MKIDKITFNEKNLNFVIDISNGEKYQISYDIYEKLELKVDLELTEDQLCKIKSNHDLIKAREIGLKFASYKQRTSFEVIKKLKLSKISEKIIDLTIEFLERNGFIDDEAFSIEYLKQALNYKKYSIRKAKMKMFEKGLNKDLIQSAIEEIYSYELERENALYHAQKKSRMLDLSDQKSKEKVFRFLISNGFDYQISNSVLEEIINER